MQHACFQLKIRPSRLQEYKLRHQAVWHEFLTELQQNGWRNYSLFLAPDGLVVGYFEADDIQTAMESMATTPVNARWQTDMREYLEEDSLNGPLLLEEVFNLERQLDRSARSQQ